MKKFLMAMALVLGFASASLAIPLSNVANDGIEDRSDKSIFATYQNSGKFLFISSGNNNDRSDVESALHALLPTYASVTLTLASIALACNVSNSNSGTWSVKPSSTTIDFYSVKAGNTYAMYLVNPAAATGTWSTFDLWASGFANGCSDLSISHFTGNNPNTPNTPVPEPGTLILLGTGLVSLGLYRRRAKK